MHESQRESRPAWALLVANAGMTALACAVLAAAPGPAALERLVTQFFGA